MLFFVGPVFSQVGGLLGQFGAFFRSGRCLFRLISPLAGPVGGPAESFVKAAGLGECLLRVQVGGFLGLAKVALLVGFAGRRGGAAVGWGLGVGRRLIVGLSLVG